MEHAYYAITDVGPFRLGQVVVLPESDGWTRTGYLRELINPAPGPEVGRGGPRQDRY